MSSRQAVEYQVGEHAVRVSNPDKIYFPERGFTKRDVVDYYLAVGEGILRALRERPTTLERWPGGVVAGATRGAGPEGRGAGGAPPTRQGHRGDAFYQKRAPKSIPPWLSTATIAFPSGRTADEICPTELAAVAWCANLGTITFHPWPVRRGHPDQPDELRIDLDPQPGTDFGDAAKAAIELRAVLDELGMVGFPKTSGGRGVHVYVRIRPEWSFVQVRRAGIALGRELERRRPDAITTSWWKEERGARVFVDYNQMARDRTIACAYSLRPNRRATVSTPVSWDELPDVEPDDFDLASVPGRVAERGDPHAGIDDVAYSIEPLLEWAARDEANGLGDLPYPPDHPKMPGEPPRVQPSRARKPPAS